MEVSNSDLPFDKYKVFWSNRFHGASALDSVLVQQKIISKEHLQTTEKPPATNKLPQENEERLLKITRKTVTTI